MLGETLITVGGATNRQVENSEVLLLRGSVAVAITFGTPVRLKPLTVQLPEASAAAVPKNCTALKQLGSASFLKSSIMSFGLEWPVTEVGVVAIMLGAGLEAKPAIDMGRSILL